MVINWIWVSNVDWPHIKINEQIGCLTAQKLDCVMSAMCCCIVLLEDKHISSDAADHWQQFLHQQHFSVILSVDFIDSFNENEDGITEF